MSNSIHNRNRSPSSESDNSVVFVAPPIVAVRPQNPVITRERQNKLFASMVRELLINSHITEGAISKFNTSEDNSFRNEKLKRLFFMYVSSRDRVPNGMTPDEFVNNFKDI